MRYKLKQGIKRTLERIIYLFQKTRIGRYIYERIIYQIMTQCYTVSYHSHEMFFSAPNQLCQYRINTFASKEPETLEWVETMPESSILWDVGANIGLYSIYAAKARACRVFSFEPSVFNLELLARNIFYNNLQNKITIIPIALNSKKEISHFKMSSTNWGGALSTFGQNYDQHGDVLEEVFEYTTIGLSMDEAVNLLNIPQPQFIKIDVDGIEHLVLSGGESILRNVESVLIEINDKFDEQASKSAKYLEDAGLSLYKKCDLGVPDQFNQWWIRKEGD